MISGYLLSDIDNINCPLYYEKPDVWKCNFHYASCRSFSATSSASFHTLKKLPAHIF